MNGESSIGIYTLPCVKQRASEKWLFNTGSPSIISVMIYRDRNGGAEGGSRER